MDKAMISLIKNDGHVSLLKLHGWKLHQTDKAMIFYQAGKFLTKKTNSVNSSLRWDATECSLNSVYNICATHPVVLELISR